MEEGVEQGGVHGWRRHYPKTRGRRCRGRRCLSCGKRAAEAGGPLACRDMVLIVQIGGAAGNKEESGWEGDDKWVRCVIEWDGGRLARVKVFMRKYTLVLGCRNVGPIRLRVSIMAYFNVGNNYNGIGIVF